MWWVMQSKPIGFGCYIWGARAPKTTIFSFFFACCPVFYPSCNCLFYSLPPCFGVFAILFSILFYFSVAFICPGNSNWAQCSFLILLHIHTWELPTVITVLCSSSRAVGASLTCLDFEGKEKESVTATPLLSQKAQGFELATFQSQNCVHRLLQSYLLWSTCHVSKQLLGGEGCDFYDKITRGKQIYSSATANDAKWCFSPAKHSWHHLTWVLMCVHFSRADTVTDGEPSRTQFMSVLAVCLEQGGMNQAVTSISSNNQIEHTSDNFSTDGERETALKMAQTGLGLEKKLPFSSRQDKEFLEGLSHQHVRKLKMRLDQSADTATDKHWINCWMSEKKKKCTLCIWGQWCCHGDGAANYRFHFHNCFYYL